MDFGDAIRALKDGKRVARTGWNGKGMWLFLGRAVALATPGYGFKRNDSGQMEQYGRPSPEEIVRIMDNEGPQPSVCMKTAQNTLVVGWLASQTDMLSDDWEVIDG